MKKISFTKPLTDFFAQNPLKFGRRARRGEPKSLAKFLLVRRRGLETYSFSIPIGFFVRSETPKNTQSGFESSREQSSLLASSAQLEDSLCAGEDSNLHAHRAHPPQGCSATNYDTCAYLFKILSSL